MPPDSRKYWPAASKPEPRATAARPFVIPEGALLFLGFFALYLFRLPPAIALADGGEFATAASTLSLTHPPGYPLYAVLGKVTMTLPVGNPGFRLGLLSAASAAGAVLLLALFSRRLGAGGWAFVGAGMLALSPGFAEQASLVEKYALNMVLQCGLFLLLLHAARSGERILPLLGLAGGLSFSHHMQTIYLIPAAGLLFLRLGPIKRPRLPLILAVTAALGLSLKFVGIPLISKLGPSLLYGEVRQAGELVRYVSFRDYADRFGQPSLSARFRRLGEPGLRSLAKDAGGAVLLLSVAGAAGLFRHSPSVLFAGLAGMGVALGVTASFNTQYVVPYLIPCVAFLCALASLGFCALRNRFGRRFALLAAALALAGQGLRTLPQSGLSRFFAPVDWARNCLAFMAPGGVLVTLHDDDFFPAMYVQRVLGERSDVILLHRPYITKLWYHSQAERLYPGFDAITPGLTPWGSRVQPRELIALILAGQAPVREVAFTYLAGPQTLSGLSLFPKGCVMRAQRLDVRLSLPREAEFSAQMHRLRLRSAFANYPPGSRQAEVAGAWRAAWFKLAQRWWDRGDEAQALRCLDRAARYPAGRVSNGELSAARDWMKGP